MTGPSTKGRANRLPQWLRSPPRWATVALRVGFFLVVVGVVAKVGADNASSLRHVRLHLRWPWLIPTAAASLSAGLLMPLGWRLLIRAYGPRLGVGVTLRIWWTAQVARYVPSGAAALATRVVLAGREGVSRVLAGASLPIEVAVIVGWGSLLTGALLPSRILALGLRVALAVAAGAGLVSLPVLLRAAGRWVPRMPPPLPGRAADRRVYEGEGFYALNSVLRTAAFVLLATALLPVRGSDVALLSGAFNAGAVGGLVSIAPGGLGVREGILTLVLRTRFGFGDAAALAVALRAWDIAIDIIWVITARLAGLRRQ